MEGWIKLHRKIWDNPIVTKDPEHLAVWIWLLTNAYHSPRPAIYNGEKITLQPGQLITGRRKIAAETHVSESKTKRILTEFKSDQQIDQQTNRHGSLITIVRWLDYQKSDPQNGQPMANRWPTDGQPMATNKELKNEKNERDLSYMGSFDNSICSPEAYQKLKEIRKKIRDGGKL